MIKKTIQFLLALLILNIYNCYGVFAGTLNETLGITTYWHYGGGTPHLNLDAVKEFQLQRAFVDNTVVALDSMGRFKTEPTPHGNYKYDTDLRNRKALGHYNYWSTQGLMDWQESGTYIDPKTGAAKNRSMRKTCIPLNSDPNNPETWKDLAELCKRIAAHYNGKGILDAIGFQNEYDFKWNVWRTMRQKEYAVLFKECYKAVRSVNTEIDIYTGGSIYPSPDSVLVFLEALKAEFAETGEAMPTDFFIDVHIYMRNSSNDQTSGTHGITPEAAKVYELGIKFDKIVKDWSLKGFVFGESGWSPYSGKQSAPVLQGYDPFNAQGLCTVRASLIMATILTFKGFYFWHCNQKYDGTPYNFGFNYTNWTATQARIVTQEYRNLYGDYDIQNFRQKDQLYAVDMYVTTDSFISLVWTDQNKFGEYDAKPRIGTLELPNNSPLITPTSPISAQVYTAPATVVLSVNASDSDGNVTRVEFKQNGNLIFTDTQYPYTYTVANLPSGTYTFSITAFDNSNLFSTIGNIGIEVNPAPQTQYNLTTQLVNGKRRIYWSDGQQAILSHADSPEGGLNPSWQTSFADLCRALPKRGINAITVTLRGDDVTSIFPFTTSSGTTPDRLKMELWKYQLLIFINECKARNLRPVIIAYIGERTNFNRTLAQYQSWLSVLADVLKSGEDISGYFIFGIEEIGQSWSDNQVSSWWNPLNAYIKSVMPKCLTMLHNNPSKKFWRATSPVLQVDVIDIQETTIANMEASANDVLSRGYAVHLHEWYGAIKASQSDATNISKLNQQLAVSQRTGCKCSGIFANDIDTQRPDTNKLKNVHIAQGNYFYGNVEPPDDTIIPPTPTTLTVIYSKNYSLSPPDTLSNGSILPTGGMWFGVKQGTGLHTFILKKGTSTQTFTDNSAPFQFKANWLQVGSYTLTVNGSVIAFSVN